MVSETIEAPQTAASEFSTQGNDKMPVDRAALIERAHSVIKRNTAWCAGAALLPFPVIDVAVLTGVMIKMVSELCSVHGIPFRQSLARPIVISLLGSLGASILASVLAASTAKLLPGVGTLFSRASLPATSASISYAVGHVFHEHFRGGGTLENFNLAAGRRAFKRKAKEASNTESDTQNQVTR